MRPFLLCLIVAGLAAPTLAMRGDATNEIIVTGVRDGRDPIFAFIEEVTVETDGQIAKFAVPICPIAIGLPVGHAEVIEARIRQIADHLGLGAEEGPCRANVVVAVADEGGDFVRQLRRERPEVFAALELPDIRSIMRLRGPVRAWQVVEPRGIDGRPMERISFIQTGPSEPPRPVARGFMLTGVMPSITGRPIRQDIVHSFIVFDVDALEGLTLLQIADHAAMRALARTTAAPLQAGRSIITLFADRDRSAEAARELTSWDAAYLRALYRTSNAVTAHQQRGNLARTMRRDLESSH